MRQKIPTQRIGLVLLDGFALMSYAALIEPFRAANVLADAPLYSWQHIAAGAAGAASNGARIVADARSGQVGLAGELDMVFVFAGGDPRGGEDAGLFAWLRRLARQGVTVGGVSAGPYVLAQAGLLAGRRATIHWEHVPAMQAAFPEVALEGGLYVIDGRVITCAGGTAGLDLALALIRRDHGEALAGRVGEWFIRTAAREAEGPQRPRPAERHGTTNGAVLAALALMEAHVAAPLPREQVARRVGLSLRQLERLFVAHQGRSLAEAGMAIRLAAAAHALRTTDAPVTSVALDCGFASAAHFARRFAAAYGAAPARWRRDAAP